LPLRRLSCTSEISVRVAARGGRLGARDLREALTRIPTLVIPAI